jgi:dTDP-4-amino-4,6-dideoxy-D-galactose acyltransferase
MIQYLDFDSELFGLSVGSYTIEGEVLEDKSIENVTDYDLIYLYTKLPKKEMGAFTLKDFSEKYIDEKVIFERLVEDIEPLKTNVSISTNKWKDFTYEKLLNLAYSSGKFSRFFLDVKFGAIKAKKMYEIWLHKSLSLDLADEVYVSGEKFPSGFLTVRFDEGLATVGLIAVDESFRGQGIGKELLNHLNNRCILNGIEKIIIPTQRVNHIACNFYRKSKYREVESSFIYHYWKENG